MAVAYGLTIPLPSLGHYVLPDDVPDQTPVRRVREIEDDFVHGDW
jgi:hypothetical protein